MPADIPFTIDDEIQGLVALYGAGRMSEAETGARALIARLPDALVPYNILGAALLGQGKSDAAVPCFQQAVEIEPDLAEAHGNLGIALQGAGRFEDAATSHRRAIELKPDYAEGHNNLGVALSDLGRIDEAVAAYRKALALEFNYAEAHNNLGAALQERGELEAAAASYRQALDLMPDYAEAHSNLGGALRELRQYDAAVESCRRALALSPDNAEVQCNLGNALKDQGFLDEAVAAYEAALRLEPSLIAANNNLGNALRERGALDAAVARFEKVLEIAPGHAEAHNNLGVALKAQGRTDAAAECYRRALEIKPDYAEAQMNLGVALLARGDIDAAIASYRAADPNGEDVETAAILLECHYRQGDMPAFDRQLAAIRTKPAVNFRAAAASAFAAQQFGEPNAYEFCPDPVGLVTAYNIFEETELSPDVLSDIEDEIKGHAWNERFSPGHISSGYKSIGNLFLRTGSAVQSLEATLRHYIGEFHEAHKLVDCRLMREWPDEYGLDGWYIRLFEGGEISAHIHTAWLGGVFYVRVPEDKTDNGGNIEFTLRGYDLPVRRDDYPRRIIETRPGTLVLFPSSLPHRVFPFAADEERICIAFDMIPR